MKSQNNCANCLRELPPGVDCLRVDEGVISVKGGFIPLENSLVFCCDRCLKEYFDISDLPSMPSRIP